MINNEDLKNELFKETHDLIYNNLFPIILKENKPVFDRIKKERTKDKKLYNFKGSFISSYLQEIENRLLMSMYKSFNEKGSALYALMAV